MYLHAFQALCDRRHHRVGKSTAVTLLLNKAIAADPKLRVLILDPHNEFAAAFPDQAVVIDTDTLDLPFWFFRLEELAEVIFRGRPPVPDELDILRDVIADAKKAFKGGESGLMRRQTEKSSITADTPVPYRIADLLALIDERIGRLEGRNDKPYLRSLKVRIVSAVNDPRYHFMFSQNTITDTIEDTIAKIFRIPGDGKPIATFELAGIPSEVVNSLASVLCRMAFEIGLWGNGAIHMLVVCEEAHRYVPADPSLGFVPTRQAIARIAKEGRKYGVSLGIITQRPASSIRRSCRNARRSSPCGSPMIATRKSSARRSPIRRSPPPASFRRSATARQSPSARRSRTDAHALCPRRRCGLPRAHGITDKVDDDAPPLADLRSIVSRMRAVNGPDISSFQQSYLASQTKQAPVLEDDNWSGKGNGTEVADSLSRRYPAFEPYSPDMLPRSSEPGNPEIERFSRIREQVLSGEAERLSGRPAKAPGQSDAGFGKPAPRQEGSLRESLLRRPLGSLIRK